MKLTIDKLREMIKDLKKEHYDVLLATPSKQAAGSREDNKVLYEEEKD
jgi:hypothetical protein|tara:strand:+ start:182 stop:325 length:144 start_codon:yes stop_codon:yes gene_type:complete